ncbi:dethiobiotin synthase [Brevundimonas sp. NPDC090276]|uniref:dethiobiotin synthase n=1 Tax=Brevundimonas sp. NPDC090276 TaxID=3363956 RepID=UPI003839ECB9
MNTVIVTGTDTGIGKTVFSAGLTRALGATYWKPVQSGLEEATDSATVAHLSGRPVLPEAYRLQLPASPHLSAEAEGVEIDIARLTPPPVEGPLVIEGAGGLMVPLTRQHLFLDVIAGWTAPVVLVARTSLGTINHSLLSLAALRSMGCTVAGVAFVGDEMADSRRAITEMGQVRDLGRLPFLADLTPGALAAAFGAIDIAAIRETL